jgi:inorganic pyrophosphatase/exopolyphosphatase
MRCSSKGPRALQVVDHHASGDFRTIRDVRAVCADKTAGATTIV